MPMIAFPAFIVVSHLTNARTTVEQRILQSMDGRRHRRRYAPQHHLLRYDLLPMCPGWTIITWRRGRDSAPIILRTQFCRHFVAEATPVVRMLVQLPVRMKNASPLSMQSEGMGSQTK